MPFRFEYIERAHVFRMLGLYLGQLIALGKRQVLSHEALVQSSDGSRRLLRMRLKSVCIAKSVVKKFNFALVVGDAVVGDKVGALLGSAVVGKAVDGETVGKLLGDAVIVVQTG